MDPTAPQTEQPWYDGGLRFRCTMCGDCCTGAAGFVWVNDDETRAIADFLAEPLHEFLGLRTRILSGGRSLREREGGDCIFYDKAQGCTIYPVRPRQCRTWPFWESNLKRPRDWDATCKVCPGSGQGDLIPADEITARMKVIRI